MQIWRDEERTEENNGILGSITFLVADFRMMQPGQPTNASIVWIQLLFLLNYIFYKTKKIISLHNHLTQK